ncbi:MAG: hypothetical protein WA919_25815 [Coleofasciculaceae cyanobacterium]
MRFTVLTSTILLVIMGLANRPSLAQTDLNVELKQALCDQNWGKAIEIVDQMRAEAPQSAEELVMYRSRLQALIDSGARVDNWPSDCPKEDNDSTSSSQGTN